MSKHNGAMQQALDPAAERGLRPQPASASSVPDGGCYRAGQSSAYLAG